MASLLAHSALGRRRDGVDRGVWSLAVGERIAERAEPVQLTRGSLLVRVTSSAWAQELSLLAPSMIRRLQEHGIPVSTLRFVVGEVTHPPPTGRRVTRPEPRRLSPELQSHLDRIEDPELRRAIADAATWSGTRGTEDEADDG